MNQSRRVVVDNRPIYLAHVSLMHPNYKTEVYLREVIRNRYENGYFYDEVNWYIKNVDTGNWEKANIVLSGLYESVFQHGF